MLIGDMSLQKSVTTEESWLKGSELDTTSALYNPRQGGYAASVRYNQSRITLTLYRRTRSLGSLDILADADPSL
jgi:hypothetical protein